MYWGVFTFSIIACFVRIMCPNFSKNIEKSCAYLREPICVKYEKRKKIDKKVLKIERGTVIEKF